MYNSKPMTMDIYCQPQGSFKISPYTWDLYCQDELSETYMRHLIDYSYDCTNICMTGGFAD